MPSRGTRSAMPVTPEQFKAAMASFAAGVTVVTTIDAAGKPAGLTVTAFSAVSKVPPLCLVCIGHEADAYPVMSVAKSYAVNMLRRDQRELAATFATHGADKFEGVDYRFGEKTGCPLLAGVLAHLECTVTSRVPAGDHDIIIASVEHIDASPGEGLAYFRGRYSDIVQR
jgi:flavin reductase (DIM6/NTAB) family NADH-FMN oxidoreductase RutF